MELTISNLSKTYKNGVKAANESEKIIKEFIHGKNITDVKENQQVDLPEQNSDLKRENDKQPTTASSRKLNL